jgi:hypothetical protein
VAITAYIQISKPGLLTAPAKTRNKLKNEDLYVQKGPFKFQSLDSYTTFLSKIASVLPCPKANIIEAKITWKPQKPANATALPLGGDTGYSALVDEFASKKSGRVVILMMPPPAKPVDDKPVCEYKSCHYMYMIINFAVLDN